MIRPAARPDTPAACWAFGPPETEILVRNAEALLAHLPVFLAGWPFRRVADAAGLDPPVEVVERPGGQISVVCAGPAAGGAVFSSAFTAARGLADALVGAWLARSGDLICLRAASVRIDRGLVVLMGDSLAGKSSVALHLAASGHRLFGEDRLALRLVSGSPSVGVCLGLTPRVALPLPPDCGARFAEYVEGFTEMRDADTAYLKLWEGEAAGFAEEAPVVAFAVLVRRQPGPCGIARAAATEIAEALQASCVPPRSDDGTLARALTALASRIPAYRLCFSSSRKAAAALTVALRDLPPG